MILDLIVIGLAIALSPLPLAAFLIVLPSEHGVRNGAAFLTGWLASLAVVVTITVLITGNHPPKPKTNPPLAVLAVKIAVGGFLLVYAFSRQRQRRRRPKPPKKIPKWQQRVDSMSPWFALVLGPALQAWALVGAGAATVVEAKLSSVASVLALFGYCLLASSTYLAMELYAVARPVRSHETLAQTRAWIDDHTDPILIIGCLAVGLWLIGKSSYLIAS